MNITYIYMYIDAGIYFYSNLKKGKYSIKFTRKSDSYFRFCNQIEHAIVKKTVQ